LEALVSVILKNYFENYLFSYLLYVNFEIEIIYIKKTTEVLEINLKKSKIIKLPNNLKIYEIIYMKLIATKLKLVDIFTFIPLKTKLFLRQINQC